MKLPIHSLFLVYFICATALAQQTFRPMMPETCDSKGTQHSLGHISDILRNLQLNHWSATPQQIGKAPCKTKTAPSEQEMVRFLDSKKTLSKSHATINGIQFKDEDHGLLRLFQDMHRPRFESDPTPQLKSKCQKVICALQEIYGKKEGLQLAYMAAKFGYNGSHKVKENTTPWKAAELDAVLISLSDYPSSIHPISRGQPLVRGPRGLNMGTTVANAVIMVFDSWDDQTKWHKHSVILHELAHNIASNGNKDSSEEWLKLGGWIGKVQLGSPASAVSPDWKMANEREAVSVYGAKNPAEDFSETVVAYRYNGASLKKTHPAKYKYMKEKVFDGIEYDSEQSCQKGSDTERNIAKLEQFAKASKLETSGISGKIINDPDMMRRLIEICRADVLHSLGGSISHTDVCVREKLGGIYLEREAASRGLQIGPVGDQFIQPIFELNPQVYQDVSLEAKNQMVGEIGEIIKAHTAVLSSSRFFGMRSGSKEECKEIGKYIDQRFTESYSAISQKDKFFFFKRRHQLANWASSVCTYRSPGARNIGAGFSWGPGTLREAVAASIP